MSGFPSAISLSTQLDPATLCACGHARAIHLFSSDSCEAPHPEYGAPVRCVCPRFREAGAWADHVAALREKSRVRREEYAAEMVATGKAYAEKVLAGLVIRPPLRVPEGQCCAKAIPGGPHCVCTYRMTCAAHGVTHFGSHE